MPRLSPFRQPFIQAISDGIKLKELEAVMPLHRHTLSAAKNLKVNTLLTTKYVTKVKRLRISHEERKLYKDLLLEACPIKSGECRYIKDPETGI